MWSRTLGPRKTAAEPGGSFDEGVLLGIGKVDFFLAGGRRLHLSHGAGVYIAIDEISKEQLDCASSFIDNS